MNLWADVAAGVLLVAAFVGSARFIWIYTRHADWWRSEVGWYLVTFPGVLGLLALNGLTFRALGTYPGRTVVNLVLFVIWVGAVWWASSIARRELKRSRQTKRGGERG